MDFGAGYVNVLDRVMPARSPDTIRFGFLASTGGKRDAHLLSDVRIGTVMTPPDIDFTKTVSGANEGTYNLDDTVQYKFLIDNNGDASLYDLQLSDPSVQDISCDGIPGASIAELGVDSRAVCTASHIISETDRDSLHYLNTATISLEVPGGEPTTLATDSVDVPVNPGAEDASKVIHPGGIALFNLWDTGSSLGLVQPSVSDKVSVALLGTDGKPASNNTVFVPEQGTWVFSGVPGSENEGSSATGEVKFTPIDNDYAGTVTPVKYRVTSKVLANDVAGMAEGTLSVTISNAPVPVCTKAEHKGSGAFWQFGNKAQLAFGATGATPSVGAATGVISGNATSFTVSDMWGNLQFTVDPGQGRIITKSGAPMTRGGDGDDADDEITFDLGAGASPVTAFPLEQGSGKYVVVTSSATATNPGQLTYRVIDMALNQGEGGLEGEMSTNLGLATAGSAVTSAPNADENGYWVINPQRGLADINAYAFDKDGPVPDGEGVKTVVSTPNAASGVLAGTLGYEDIRFSPDFTKLATVASNNDPGGQLVGRSARRTQVRLLTFNAETGGIGLVGTQAWGADNRLGYSIEFSPNGRYLYLSSVQTSSTGAHYRVQRADLGTGDQTLPDSASNVGNALGNGGAIRLGTDRRLYWAGPAAQLRYLADPDTTDTTWSTLDLAQQTTGTQALANTLADCAIPPRGFNVQMLDGAGAPLAGAEFALYPNPSGSPSAEPVEPGFTAAEGQVGLFSITGLDPGNYLLKETKAPQGKTLLAQAIRVTVKMDGTIEASTVPRSPQVALVSESQGQYTIKITATSAGRLPFAGGHGKWLVAAGTTLFVAVVAGTLWRRRQLRVTGGRYAPRH